MTETTHNGIAAEFFTDAACAVDEAIYMAEKTGRAYVIVRASGGLKVVPASLARAHEIIERFSP